MVALRLVQKMRPVLKGFGGVSWKVKWLLVVATGGGGGGGGGVVD